VDIPVKLPAPDFGTDAHAGPKAAVADAAPDGMAEDAPDGMADDGELAAAFGAELDVLLPELPHAAAPMATLAASRDPARRR
jgi:hypothetical protein